jgi:hypothetical protein
LATEQHRSAEARSTETSHQISFRQAADAARHSQARLGLNDEQYNLSVPQDMPTTAFLSTHETNPIAGSAVYWARTGNYLFEDYRNEDFANMELEVADRLKAAAASEALVTDQDIERCMSNFTSRVSPNLPASACGCCGTMDVEIDWPVGMPGRPSVVQQSAMGIESFVEYNLNSDLLIPLRYTGAQETTYSLPVPRHIENNELNRERWTRFKNVISMVVVNINDSFVRMHLYPELCFNENTTTKLCSKCNADILEGKRPVNSICTGWDIGGPERAGLPELSFAEKHCVYLKLGCILLR